MIRSWTQTHWLVYACRSMSNFVRRHRRSSLHLNVFCEAISLLYQGAEGRALIVFLCRGAWASSTDDSTLWYRSESSETLKFEADDESRVYQITSKYLMINATQFTIGKHWDPTWKIYISSSMFYISLLSLLYFLTFFKIFPPLYDIISPGYTI